MYIEGLEPELAVSKKTLSKKSHFKVCSFRADNLDKDDKIKLRLELAAVCAHNAWSNCDFC